MIAGLSQTEIEEITNKIEISLKEKSDNETIEKSIVYLSIYLSKNRKIEKTDFLLKKLNEIFKIYNKQELLLKIKMICFLNYKNIEEYWLEIENWNKNELINYFYNIIKSNNIYHGINGLIKKEIPKEFLNLERNGESGLNLLEEIIKELLKKYSNIKYKKLNEYLKENYLFNFKEDIQIEISTKKVNLKKNQFYSGNMSYDNYKLLSNQTKEKLNNKPIELCVNDKKYQLDLEHLLIFQDFCKDIQNMCYSKCYKEIKKIENIEDLMSYYPLKIKNIGNILLEHFDKKRKDAKNTSYIEFWNKAIIYQNYQGLKKEIIEKQEKKNPILKI